MKTYCDETELLFGICEEKDRKKKKNINYYKDADDLFTDLYFNSDVDIDKESVKKWFDNNKSNTPHSDKETITQMIPTQQNKANNIIPEIRALNYENKNVNDILMKEQENQFKIFHNLQYNNYLQPNYRSQYNKQLLSNSDSEMTHEQKRDLAGDVGGLLAGTLTGMLTKDPMKIVSASGAGKTGGEVLYSMATGKGNITPQKVVEDLVGNVATEFMTLGFQQLPIPFMSDTKLGKFIYNEGIAPALSSNIYRKIYNQPECDNNIMDSINAPRNSNGEIINTCHRRNNKY